MKIDATLYLHYTISILLVRKDVHLFKQPALCKHLALATGVALALALEEYEKLAECLAIGKIC